MLGINEKSKSYKLSFESQRRLWAKHPIGSLFDNFLTLITNSKQRDDQPSSSNLSAKGIKEPIVTKIVINRTFQRCIWYPGQTSYPAGIYVLKVNNRNIRTRCEICSKLIIKSCSSVSIVNFEHVNAEWVDEISCLNSKRLKAVRYFCKKLYFRCLTMY